MVVVAVVCVCVCVCVCGGGGGGGGGDGEEIIHRRSTNILFSKSLERMNGPFSI